MQAEIIELKIESDNKSEIMNILENLENSELVLPPESVDDELSVLPEKSIAQPEQDI